jgi:hypothetical protein
VKEKAKTLKQKRQERFNRKILREAQEKDWNQAVMDLYHLRNERDFPSEGC